MDKLTDSQLIDHALMAWCNHIETGDITLSAKDAADAKLPFNALTHEQMRLVIRLSDLATQFREGG